MGEGSCRVGVSEVNAATSNCFRLRIVAATRIVVTPLPPSRSTPPCLQLAAAVGSSLATCSVIQDSWRLQLCAKSRRRKNEINTNTFAPEMRKESGEMKRSLAHTHCTHTVHSAVDEINVNVNKLKLYHSSNNEECNGNRMGNNRKWSV